MLLRQVSDERFLVLVNDMLSTGEIADLFPDDELENIINGVRNEVKGAGLMDTRETCWKFFIERVRRNLKVIYKICFLYIMKKKVHFFVYETALVRRY